MAALSMAAIQRLLEEYQGKGMVLSCYADTSVVEGFRSHALGHFRDEAARIEERLAGDPPARTQFQRNLEAITPVLQSPEARHASSMAVFSAERGGLVRSFPLDMPVTREHLIAGDEPYVVPLVELFYRDREYLVAVTDSNHGRLYAAGPGGLRLLSELHEPVHRHHKASDRGSGKKDKQIQEQRKEQIKHYQKELAGQMEKAWAENPFQGIVLLGEHEVLENFKDQLSKRLASQAIHEAPQALTANEGELQKRVGEVLAEAMGRYEGRILDEVGRRLEQNWGVAAGPQNVLDALRDGQVNYVVLGPDRGETASRCTGCQSLFAGVRNPCPYCGTVCATTNLWQAIVAFALRHDLLVHFVRNDAPLAGHGGAAAVLFRDDPWRKHRPDIGPAKVDTT